MLELYVISGIVLFIVTGYGITKLSREDLKSHAYVGLVIGVIVSLLTEQPLAGIVVAGLVGAGKEIYDKYTDGVPAQDDFLITLAGGTVGAAIIFLFQSGYAIQ